MGEEDRSGGEIRGCGETGLAEEKLQSSPIHSLIGVHFGLIQFTDTHTTPTALICVSISSTCKFTTGIANLQALFQCYNEHKNLVQTELVTSLS